MKLSRPPAGVPGLWNLTKAAVFTMLLLPVPAIAASDDTRPYDDKLLRLSEILGAVHFLRELCGADDGQLWRQQMTSLIEAEGGSASRRVRFVNSFNKGYRSYRRTYQGCTGAAKEQTARFLTEGAELAKLLAEPKP
jgi:uncharacterized protein (TIGR02301 family)